VRPPGIPGGRTALRQSRTGCRSHTRVRSGDDRLDTQSPPLCHRRRGPRISQTPLLLLRSARLRDIPLPGDSAGGHRSSAGDARNRMRFIKMGVVARAESNHQHADFQYDRDRGSAAASPRPATHFFEPTEPPRPTEPIPTRRSETLPHAPGAEPVSTGYGRTDRTFSEPRAERDPCGVPLTRARVQLRRVGVRIGCCSKRTSSCPAAVCEVARKGIR
jgi:hypothetical protein